MDNGCCTLLLDAYKKPLPWREKRPLTCVELRGFEPLTPSMRTRCATGLRHSPPTVPKPSRCGDALAVAARAVARYAARRCCVELGGATVSRAGGRGTATSRGRCRAAPRTNHAPPDRYGSLSADAST